MKKLSVMSWALMLGVAVFLSGCGETETEEDKQAKELEDAAKHGGGDKEGKAEVSSPNKVKFVTDAFAIKVDGMDELDLQGPIAIQAQVEGTGELQKVKEGEVYRYTDKPKVYAIKGAKLSKVNSALVIKSAEFQHGSEVGSGGAFFQALTYEPKEVTVGEFSDKILGFHWNVFTRKTDKQKKYEELTVNGKLPPLNKAATKLVLSIPQDANKEVKIVLQGDALQYLLNSYLQDLKEDDLRTQFQGFGKADETKFLVEMERIVALLK